MEAPTKRPDQHYDQRTTPRMLELDWFRLESQKLSEVLKRQYWTQAKTSCSSTGSIQESLYALLRMTTCLVNWFACDLKKDAIFITSSFIHLQSSIRFNPPFIRILNAVMQLLRVLRHEILHRSTLTTPLPPPTDFSKASCRSSYPVPKFLHADNNRSIQTQVDQCNYDLSWIWKKRHLVLEGATMMLLDAFFVVPQNRKDDNDYADRGRQDYHWVDSAAST